MKTYTFPFAIAYADTDAGGIAYHGRYIEIAERARMNILRGIVEQKFVKDGEICAILVGTAAYIGANMMPKRIPDAVAAPFRE